MLSRFPKNLCAKLFKSIFAHAQEEYVSTRRYVKESICAQILRNVIGKILIENHCAVTWKYFQSETEFLFPSLIMNNNTNEKHQIEFADTVEHEETSSQVSTPVMQQVLQTPQTPQAPMMQQQQQPLSPERMIHIKEIII